MPEIPESAPKGHAKKKSAEARKAEADGFAVVEQNGVELRIPTGKKVPLLALEAFQNGQDILGTKLLLGEEQWSAWTDTNPLVEDYEEIGDKLSELLGN